MLSLAAVLAEAARKYPDKIAVIDSITGERIPYRELWQQTLAYAAGLRELGVGPGDVVAIQIPNLADFPRVYYATLAVGAAIVPMHLLLTPDENAYVLRDSGAKLLVAHSSQLANAAVAGKLAEVDVVSVGPAVEGVRRLEDAAAATPPLRTYVSREAEDVAVVFYTSGTTGKPKGALLTHLNLVMNTMVNVFDIHELREDDVVLGCLPLFHTFGQTVGMNATFRLGGTIVLLARFTGEAAIELMLRESVTIFHGDCREMLPRLSADLVLTDPPYGTDVIEWDEDFNLDWLCYAAVSAQKVIAFSPGTNNLLACPQRIGAFSYRWTLAPVMLGAATHGVMGFANWLPFLVYSREGVSLYKPQQDVKIVQSPKYRVPHPSPKPIDAMKWILGALPDSDCLIDPFMGSGTTLRAAKDLGRRAIGVEIEEKYCEIAANRLRQEVLAFEAVA